MFRKLWIRKIKNSTYDFLDLLNFRFEGTSLEVSNDWKY